MNLRLTLIMLGVHSSTQQLLLRGARGTHLIVNQSRSSLTPDLTPEELKRVTYFWDSAAVANHTVLLAPLPDAGTHVITVYVDGMNIEVFADDRVAITTNVFPTLPASTCVGVSVPGVQSLLLFFCG